MIEGDAPQGPRVVLSGLATVLPANWVAQADAAAAAAALHPQVRDERLVRALYQRSGVARRYSVLLAPSEEGQPPAQDFYRAVVTVDDRGPTTAERMDQVIAQMRRRLLAVAEALANLPGQLEGDRRAAEIAEGIRASGQPGMDQNVGLG